MSSSLLRSSMGNERKNQVIEVLMLSVTPRQMLTGKLVELAIVGMLQTLVWAGTGYAMLMWQPLLAIVWMAGTALLVMRAVGRVFRAQMLLSGQIFSVKRYFTVLLGRA